MTKRKRRFSIDLPGDEKPSDEVPNETTIAPKRRGPMAAAVAETATSAQTRADIEQSIREENDALAHEFVRLKNQGLIVDLVPVDAIDMVKLTRDRSTAVDPDISELKFSIREIGLSNPIRIEESEDGRYELIEGYRRLMAYRELKEEFPKGGFDRIPAGIISDGGSLEDSYRRMVDENLVRKDISFAEMGELARAYASDPNTSCDSADDAVALLFKSAGYQKRTYIRSFARLLDLIGDEIRHAPAISRNLGLAVLKQLEAQPETREALSGALARCEGEESELRILSDFAAGKIIPNNQPFKERARRPRTRSKTTFRIEAGGNEIKCIAANNRIQMSGETDFSAFERDKLERAVAAFFDALSKG